MLSVIDVFKTALLIIHVLGPHLLVGAGWWIHRLHLYRMVRPQQTSVVDMTLNHLMVSLQDLDIWEMWSSLSLALLPGPGVVSPDMHLSLSKIEQSVCKQMTVVKLRLLYSNTWNHLTEGKKTQSRLGMLSTKCDYQSYIYLILL